MATYSLTSNNPSWNLQEGDIINCDYSGTYRYINLPAGVYMLLVWGALGGSYDTSNPAYTGGKGGYSKGILTLTSPKLIYIYVGGLGTSKTSGSSGGSGGYNGGAYGGDGNSNSSGATYDSSHSYSDSYYGYGGSGGGGATDIRISSTSLHARVIVAGGGGGCGGYCSYTGAPNVSAGAGGGLEGESSSFSNGGANSGKGGTQTNGGNGGAGTSNSNDCVDSSYHAAGGGGGGGGWYGGGGGSSGETNGGNTAYGDSGGTGSFGSGGYGGSNGELGWCYSYWGGHGGGGSGYVYTKDTAKNYPSGCLLNSSMYLDNAETFNGILTFYSNTGVNEEGHSGHGYCKITLIEKNVSTLELYDITQTDTFPSYSHIINCPYTGQVVNFLALPGTYKFKVWGAQGGSYNSSYPGGRGGYSEGTLKLTEPTQLYLRVGGQGNYSATNGLISGGFNGGGNAYNGSYTSYPVGSGGGASDIRIGTDSLYARVIVAGGGGGFGSYSSSNIYSGGYGGGTSGGSGSYYNSSAYPGYGGSSTSIGTSYYGSTSNNSSYSTIPTFGNGGSGTSSGSYISGGGGGWYGGGYAYRAGAGGGSGYVYTSYTYTQYPSGCLLTSKYYLTDASTTGGNLSITLPNNTISTGNTGNGYIQIEYKPLTKKIRKGLEFSENDLVTLLPGTYKFECWGALGGSYNSQYLGGKGGYTTGILNLSEKTTLYIKVGGEGKAPITNSFTEGGNNGGGTSYTSSYTSYTAYSGGGASDIRIGADTLQNRIIVAGGGGGSFGGTNGSYYGNGGAGGGTSGGNGTSTYSSSLYAGRGGTQTARGTSYYSSTADSTSYGTLATFGQGGNANSSSSYASGGGGGWYGGGYAYLSGGGGGSGYVYTSDTHSNHPNDSLLGSQYYLTETQNIAGTLTFTSPTGINETGHSGDGFVRITIISGGLDEIYASKTKAPRTVNLTIVTYTGEVLDLTLLPGSYKLQCWGALGGTWNNLYYGGKGGYSEGILTIQEETKIYLRVGGQGNKPVLSDSVLGGFNGGGNAYNSSISSYIACSGGGASDIRIGQDSLHARVIVAGGGGGAFGGTSYFGIGGAGGGTSGIDATSTYSNSYSGKGGTLTAGGTSYYTSTANNTSYGDLATFGNGANGKPGGSYISGGGGGWYGGGYAIYGGAGGGSGYVYTSSTASNYPSGCLLTSNYYLTDASTVAGNTSFVNVNNELETGHKGDGCIKITAINGGIVTIVQLFTWSYSKIEEGDIIEFDEGVNKILLPSGKYKLECWGARGGLGGNGGYSTGELTIFKPITIYSYVGNIGSYTDNLIGIGGEASDIRINSDSLYSRVIVAGGGGGRSTSSSSITPGTGGGELGGNGTGASQQTALASGGTQTAGGTCSGSDSLYVGESGSFGYGGAGAEHTGYISGGGGGDGWYGGAGGMSVSATEGRPGGGGSGYVYNEETYMNYPEGCLLNSKYFLENSSTLGGTSSFLSPYGEPIIGNKGNGYVKITAEAIFLDNFFSRVDNKLKGTRRFLYKDTTWKNITKIYKYANGYLLIWEK